MLSKENRQTSPQKEPDDHPPREGNNGDLMSLRNRILMRIL